MSDGDIDNIQGNNVQFPSPKEKAYKMLKVWFNLGRSSTFGELATALGSLGKDALVVRCSLKSCKMRECEK